MAQKGILVSDPSVKDMTDTQWLFEFEGLYHKDEKRLEEYKAISSIVKRSIISLLGLDLFPVEEKQGVGPDGEPIVRYRMPEDHEILPLSIFVGKEELLSEIVKRHKEIKIQEEIDAEERSFDENEDLVFNDLDEVEEYFNDDDSDISFTDDPSFMHKRSVWKSEETQRYLENMVHDISKKDENLENELDVVDTANTIQSRKKEAKVYIE